MDNTGTEPGAALPLHCFSVSFFSVPEERFIRDNKIKKKNQTPQNKTLSTGGVFSWNSSTVELIKIYRQFFLSHILTCF